MNKYFIKSITMKVDYRNIENQDEVNTHKLKRSVQAPNSTFYKIKCGECQTIGIVFSNAQSTILCSECNKVLCRPTGGKVKVLRNNSYSFANSK